MTPEKLFAELLGPGLSWHVQECLFHKDAGLMELHLEHTDHLWQLERCPQCGRLAPSL